jgi:hypothetical protein
MKRGSVHKSCFSFDKSARFENRTMALFEGYEHQLSTPVNAHFVFAAKHRFPP